MTNIKKNAVIVGFGGMGQQHRRLINRTQHIKVIGTFDILKAKMDIGVANQLKAYSSLSEVLEDNQVDIVVVATPNHEHKNIVIQALKAGKHVVCEKPVTLNSGELKDILDVLKTCDTHFFVHQNRRWDEDYLIVKDIYDHQKIGDIFHIETKVHGSRGIPGDWRKEKAYGGGMMLDWGVHLIDRLLMMVNEPVESLFCKLSTIRTQDVDDGFTLHITFKSGKTALVEVGTYNYIQMPLWYVLGSQGALVIDDWDLNGSIKYFNNQVEKDAKPIVAGAGLTKTMAPRNEETLTVEKVPRISVDYNEFYDNVFDTIEGHGHQIVKNHEVMAVMKLMEDAVRSSETGEVIRYAL